MGGSGSGDVVGHEFRGNQYGMGSGAGKSEAKLGTYKPVSSNPNVKVYDETIKKAEAAISHSKDIESGITNLVTTLADETGGEPKGLEFRLKSKESTIGEIATKVYEQRISEDKALEQMTDLNRYTIAYNDNEYVDKTNKVLDGLEKKGWKIYQDKQRNYWQTGNNYKGYNVVLTNGKDKFELQFHTQTSFTGKMQNHKFFELHRTSTDKLKRYKLNKMMKQNMYQIPTPTGTENLKGVKKYV